MAESKTNKPVSLNSDTKQKKTSSTKKTVKKKRAVATKKKVAKKKTVSRKKISLKELNTDKPLDDKKSEATLESISEKNARKLIITDEEKNELAEISKNEESMDSVIEPTTEPTDQNPIISSQIEEVVSNDMQENIHETVNEDELVKESVMIEEAEKEKLRKQEVMAKKLAEMGLSPRADTKDNNADNSSNEQHKKSSKFMLLGKVASLAMVGFLSYFITDMVIHDRTEETIASIKSITYEDVNEEFNKITDFDYKNYLKDVAAVDLLISKYNAYFQNNDALEISNNVAVKTENQIAKIPTTDDNKQKAMVALEIKKKSVQIENKVVIKPKQEDVLVQKVVKIIPEQKTEISSVIEKQQKPSETTLTHVSTVNPYSYGYPYYNQRMRPPYPVAPVVYQYRTQPPPRRPYYYPPMPYRQAR